MALSAVWSISVLPNQQQLYTLTYNQLLMYQSFNDFYFATKDIPLDWTLLQDSLKIKQSKYPTCSQIQSYYHNNFKHKTANFVRSKWHKMDKLLFIWIVTQYCSLTHNNLLLLNKQDFKIFSCILGVSATLLQFKWLKLIRPSIKNKPWSSAEDELIFQLMQSNMQKKWTDIAIKLSEGNSTNVLRTAKQVRERWINYIDPSIKRDDWTSTQDQQLLKMIGCHGKKWSLLGAHFNRTQNNIKNRYNSICSKVSGSQRERFDNFSRFSLLDCGTKIEQLNKFGPCCLISEIDIQRMQYSRPIELRICGFRDLVQSKVV